MNRHEGTWQPNPLATHFIEVCYNLYNKEDFILKPDLVNNLEFALEYTEMLQPIKTIAVWHITPKTSTNA